MFSTDSWICLKWKTITKIIIVIVVVILLIILGIVIYRRIKGKTTKIISKQPERLFGGENISLNFDENTTKKIDYLAKEKTLFITERRNVDGDVTEVCYEIFKGIIDVLNKKTTEQLKNKKSLQNAFDFLRKFKMDESYLKRDDCFFCGIAGTRFSKIYDSISV